VIVSTQRKTTVIHAVLREEILGGVWAVGGQLPNEVEMARRFGCSAGTVNKAVALLVHEGLVVRKNRSGTRVISNSLTPHPRQAQLDAFAFIYPSDKHESIWRTVSGFQDAARDAGRRILTLTTAADQRRDAELFSRLEEFDVKGAVIYPSLLTPEDYVHFTQILLKSKVPVVLTVNFPGLGFPSVVIDGFHAGYTMTRHLIGRGAKRIGHLSNGAWALHMRDRYLGYCWALEEAGLEEPENGVLLEAAMNPNFRDPVAEPKRIAENFLTRCGKLDAVMCANDFLGIGLTVAARGAGLRVPEDLMVVGIDDLALSATENISLTTYQISFENRGHIAFHLLEDLLAEKPLKCLETRVRGQIVVRGSA